MVPRQRVNSCALTMVSYEVGLVWLSSHRRKLRLGAQVPYRTVTARTRAEPAAEPGLVGATETGREPGVSSLTCLSLGNPDS